MIAAKQKTRIITHTRYSRRIFRGKKNGVLSSAWRRSARCAGFSALADLRQLACAADNGHYSMKSKENSAERLAIPG
jgi:hypothetical protein